LAKQHLLFPVYNIIHLLAYIHIFLKFEGSTDSTDKLPQTVIQIFASVVQRIS